MTERCQLKDFLHEFILSDEQLREMYSRFVTEIRKGLAKATNANADTKCFVTYVQDFPNGEETGKFLSLDLGGSKFRVLMIDLKGSGEARLESTVYELPEATITGPGIQLFDYIAKCLQDFIKKYSLENENLPLGFTFSFPCEQQGLKKATLVRWTKGFSSEGVVNQDVVRLMQEAIGRRGLNIDVVAILNDTTGTLMSCAHRNPECRMGLIVGTGSNACYVERVENVEMMPKEYKQNSSKTHVIINVEWGAFGERGALDFIRTEFDVMIDKASINKGTQIYEKMISGMYLGELVRLVLLRAIRENLMFTECAVRRRLSDTLTKNKYCFESRFISEIDSDIAPEFKKTKKVLLELFELADPCPDDCEKLKFICDTIAKRSGNMIGVTLSGLINKMNEPSMIVGVDGSVYRYHQSFESYMRQTMDKFVNPDLKYDIMLSEDGSGRGAALVAAVVAVKKN